MRITGIDPGLKGGIVTIQGGEVISSHKMPIVHTDNGRKINLVAIASLLHNMAPSVVVIEKVHSMPAQGVRSTFTFGMGFGGLCGVCAGLGIDISLVSPLKWQKRMVSHLDRSMGKKRSLIYCKDRWPQNEPLHRHDGMADAACIAAWYEAETVRLSAHIKPAPDVRKGRKAKKETHGVIK